MALVDRCLGQAGEMIRARLRCQRKRAIEHVQQCAVLPEADPKRDREYPRADEQPLSELIEVVDDAQAIVVPNGPKNLRHLPTSSPSAPRGDFPLKFH